MGYKIQFRSQVAGYRSQAPGVRRLGATLLGGICCVALAASFLFAQEDLEALKDKYFSEHNYNGFVEYLKNLEKKEPPAAAEISYYIALSRYSQLKYLEESQGWDEYFSQGNNYREELTVEAGKAASLTSSWNSINLYSKTLLWQLHKDQEDVFAEDALKSLMDSAEEYAAKKGDLGPVKYIADKLYSYGLKAESKKLYNIYVEKLLKTESKDEELKKAAEEAFKVENLSLSVTFYDAYISRLTKSSSLEKLVPELTAIAQDFVYKDKGANDPDYAEKIFGKIEELTGVDALAEETAYLRAYNLEKSRLYAESLAQYTRLLERFPGIGQADKILFKCGIISTYVLRDPERGEALFEKLAAKPAADPYVISSIYQLGLLRQWKKDFAKAKEYYQRLIQLAGKEFGDTRQLAEQRLKELEKDAELEYNLKAFLDASLAGSFDMTKVDLISRPYIISKAADTRISANTFLPESGCMSIETNYLWSGHLGSTAAAVNQPEFTTSYSYPGTKEINLVVVTPSGIIDRSIDLVDVE